MSRKKTTATPERPHAFMVRLSDEERAALEGLAAKRRLTFADALRTAIMADAEKHGVAAEAGVMISPLPEHLRLSVGSRKGPKVGPSFVVWCGTSEPPARTSTAPTRDDGGDGGRSA